MNIHILASLKSHTLTGNPWHLGSIPVGNIKEKQQSMTRMCKIEAWFEIKSQHDLFVLLTNALLSISSKF